jgi:hypothetical protein
VGWSGLWRPGGGWLGGCDDPCVESQIVSGRHSAPRGSFRGLAGSTTRTETPQAAELQGSALAPGQAGSTAFGVSDVRLQQLCN